MEQFNRGNSDIFSLEVDDSSKSNFLEMARWTKFLAIMGFIVMGIVVLAGIGMAAMVRSGLTAFGSYSAVLAALGPMGVVLLYLLIAAIYIYPIYALLKYSTGIKYAMNNNDKTRFNEAIRYLRNMFKYLGILMVIILCIYGFAIIVGIIAASSRF